MSQSLHNITLKQAQAVLDKHVQTPGPITFFERFPQSNAGQESYLIRLEGPRAYVLKLGVTDVLEVNSPYAPNALVSQYKLLSYLHTQKQFGSVPLPSPIAFDDSRSLLLQAYILLGLPPGVHTLMPLTAARSKMSLQQNVMTDLKMGALLHALHEVQNEWFGPPVMETDGVWSWQEAFTLMLEEALCATEASGGLEIGLDMSEIRRLLSRAIGAFIFDDAEVPSFIWFMGGEEDVYVSVREDDSEPQIVLALADLSYALWGDPLLERLFVDPKPSQALLEGYQTPLILYPRQKTKRMWYTLYTALVILLGPSVEETRRTWALDASRRAAEELKNAPSY
ncbi:hypothetical protein K488DRAFT_81340 [Vararia minispora EC-137]|uniref:Uncharacterized protein n=1 Tax=Vararia minispora EC-137 TaxID=1314806 RepID=A0ACB8QZM2_9AGAM|nr:hypothetical protein K488DRAFT_81340 [Vararia minispora EC-137]